jgi:hypothetical protein
MKYKIRRILIEVEDEDALLVMTMEVTKENNYGWSTTGTLATLFPRYLRLMTNLSDFLKVEK